MFSAETLGRLRRGDQQNSEIARCLPLLSAVLAPRQELLAAPPPSLLVRMSNMEGRSGPAGTAAPFLGGLRGWRISRSDSDRNIILIMSYKKIVKC